MVEIQRPESLHHAPERNYKQSSREAYAAPCSSESNFTTNPFNHNVSTIQSQAQHTPSSGHDTYARTDTEISIEDEFVKTQLESSVFHIILYLLFAVPALAFVSFLYTIITSPFLLVSKLCTGAATQRMILSGHQLLFRPHTRVMHIQPPEHMKDIICLGIGTLPVSILVVFSGVFVVLGQVYSLLLSEHDREHRSLNRVASIWYSWLYIFSSETQPDKLNDIV